MADVLAPICDSCAKSELDFAEGTAPLLLCSRCKTAKYCNRTCQVREWKEHRKTCIPPCASPDRAVVTSSPKRILLIMQEDYSRLDDMYASFYKPIRARCDLLELHRINDAITHVASNPAAVILFEPSLMRWSARAKYQSLNNTLVAYVKAGGTLIFGCQCSSQVTPPDCNYYFGKVWALPWSLGDYCREDFPLSNASGIIDEKTMPRKYNVKAAQLKNVKEEAVIYGREGGGIYKSAAVVWQKYGDGHIAWLGDMNNEEDTRNIMMMMCGLWHRLGA